VNLDRAVNALSEEVENLSDLRRIDTLHESSPDGGKAWLSQVLPEDRADLWADGARCQPSREAPRTPERSDRQRCIAHEESSPEIRLAVAPQVVLDRCRERPAVDVGLPPHQIPRVDDSRRLGHGRSSDLNRKVILRSQGRCTLRAERPLAAAVRGSIACRKLE
jgi:hypothetical protein